MGVLCTWVKLLTDLQIWAVNYTKIHLAAAFRPDPLGSYRESGEEREGRENKGLEGRREREGKDVNV